MFDITFFYLDLMIWFSLCDLYMIFFRRKRFRWLNFNTFFVLFAIKYFNVENISVASIAV